MIRYEIKPYERAFTFQILSQDKAVKDAIVANGGSFISSNGWKISIVNSPELKAVSKQIFLRGTLKDADERIDRTWNLPSNAERDLIIKNIHQAMSEIISYARIWKRFGRPWTMRWASEAQGIDSVATPTLTYEPPKTWNSYSSERNLVFNV